MLSNLISSQYPLRKMTGGVNETRRNVISEQFQIENMQNMGYRVVHFGDIFLVPGYVFRKLLICCMYVSLISACWYDNIWWMWFQYYPSI